MNAATHDLDPITIEIVRNGVLAVTEEMKTNLMRTAYNMIIYEALDFTVGLFDARGNTVSIGLGWLLIVCALPENRRFMKGLFAWVGFRTEQVDYVRLERHAGETKFNGFRLVNLAIEGLTSFSTAPLRIATFAGVAIAIGAMLYALFIIVHTLVMGVDMPGYASLISVVLFMSGIQLVALGLVGEYVGRTYIESKRRPAFVIRKIWRSSGEAQRTVNAVREDHRVKP